MPHTLTRAQRAQHRSLCKQLLSRGAQIFERLPANKLNTHCDNAVRHATTDWAAKRESISLANRKNAGCGRLKLRILYNINGD